MAAAVVPGLNRPANPSGAAGASALVSPWARTGLLPVQWDCRPSALRRWILEGGMAVSTPGASIPIGVYRGRGCGISAIGVYENFIGRQVQKVADFMAEQPTSWAQFENGNLTSAADVSVWQGVLGPSAG